MTERTVVIAYVDQEIETGPIITGLLFVWHFGDTPVEIQLRSDADRYAERQWICVMNRRWKSYLVTYLTR